MQYSIILVVLIHHLKSFVPIWENQTDKYKFTTIVYLMFSVDAVLHGGSDPGDGALGVSVAI